MCPQCAEDFTPEPADIPPGFDPGETHTLRHGLGCKACLNTGYRGRIGIYEMLSLSEPTRELILKHANAGRIATRAEKDGDLFPMRDDGFAKARASITTISEVMRVVRS